MKYFFSILTILLVVMFGFSAFSADKVVVIPLSSSTQHSNPVIGHYAIDGGNYTSGNGYFVSTETVTLPADGTCAITATGDVYHLDSGDTVRGPYIKVARRVDSDSPEAPGFGGSRLLYVGAVDSTGASTTIAWSITANTTYNFGCLFSQVPANWQNDYFNCQVSWVCAVD